MVCRTCRWWPESGYSEASKAVERSGIHGYHCDGSHSDCRRHAPIADPSPEKINRFGGDAIWPVTRWDHFCGDWTEFVRELKGIPTP